MRLEVATIDLTQKLEKRKEIALAAAVGSDQNIDRTERQNEVFDGFVSVDFNLVHGSTAFTWRQK